MKTIVSKIPTRQSLITGEKAVEIGYPWVSFGGIIALEFIVDKKMRVMEFGSGGSTVFFSENCKSVLSFESESQWLEKVKKKTAKNSNVKLILAGTEKTLDRVSKEPNNYYDIVLVDAKPGKDRRLRFANASISKLKIGGWMVVDNYDRFSMNGFDYSKWRVFTFDEFNNYQGHGTRLCQKTHEI